MADYKKITIDITENGYIVTVINGSKNRIGKQFVFDNIKKMRNWIKNNLAATGEVERFSKALDNEVINDTIDKQRNSFSSPFIDEITTPTGF